MLHLIVPGLAIADANQADTPALHALLARGRRLDRPAATGLTEALGQILGLAPPYPIAALSHAHDSGQADGAHRLRADPIYLHLNIDQLILGDPRQLSLGMDEALPLTASLNAHFEPDGLHFEALAPDRWYVRLDRPAAISTTPLDTAIGRSIDATLPRGAEASLWRRYLNEAQMVLHDHPINQAREARGLPPVNSVWFWGEGVAPEPASAGVAALYADAAIAGAMAHGMGIRHEKAPSGLAELGRVVSGDGIVAVLDEAALLFENGISDRHVLLRHYEARWFAPLLGALQGGRIDEAILTGIGARPFHLAVTRRDAWKLWRRRPTEPLSAPCDRATG